MARDYTRDRDIDELRLRLLRSLGCNEKFLFATADFYASSLRIWSGESDFYNASLWEHAKYREGSSQDVLAQREMEKRRSPLVKVPPLRGQGFSRYGGLSIR